MTCAGRRKQRFLSRRPVRAGQGARRPSFLLAQPEDISDIPGDVFINMARIGHCRIRPEAFYLTVLFAFVFDFHGVITGDSDTLFPGCPLNNGRHIMKSGGMEAQGIDDEPTAWGSFFGYPGYCSLPFR